MSWSKTKFETLYAEASRNGLYKANEFHGSGTRIVNMKELFAFPFIRNQEMQRLRLTDTEINKFSLQPGDLLFARRSLIEAGAGKCVTVMAHDEPMVFESSIIRVRLRQDCCNPLFYYYYFQSPVGRSVITAIVTGAAQKGIRGSELANVQVHNPALSTQQRIAEILSSYDRLIDNNNRRIALLEESIHQLYKEWFVCLRFPGYESVKIVDGIPEGWNRKTLKDIALSIRQSIHPSKTELNTPYVGLEHIPRQSIALSSWGYSNQVDSNKFVFTKSDILFGKIRPYFHKVVFAPINGICSSDAIVIRPINQDLFGLTLSIVSSVAFVDYTSKTSKEGSKMPRANWDVMEQYPILIPSPKLLQEFNTLVSLATHQIRNLIFTNQHLNQARDLLLPRLMSGSIAV